MGVELTLTQDQQIKILEILEYAEALPARPLKDVLTPGMLYYSPTIADLLSQELTDRQHTEIEMYLARADKIDQAENDAIERLSFTSIGRGDLETNQNETTKLKAARRHCGFQIRQILGLPTKGIYFSEFR